MDLPDLEATRRLGLALGAIAPPTLVLGLVGTLGAGKTTFTRALAEGAGCPDIRLVTSPTFVLIHEYPARIPVYHFDTYRLRHPQDFADLGVEEYFAGDGVCLVEWADRVQDFLPHDWIEVAITVIGETARTVQVRAFGERWRFLIADWHARFLASTTT